MPTDEQNHVSLHVVLSLSLYCDRGDDGGLVASVFNFVVSIPLFKSSALPVPVLAGRDCCTLASNTLSRPPPKAHVNSDTIPHHEQTSCFHVERPTSVLQ